jgi:hypothetical protein
MTPVTLITTLLILELMIVNVVIAGRIVIAVATRLARARLSLAPRESESSRAAIVPSSCRKIGGLFCVHRY